MRRNKMAALNRLMATWDYFAFEWEGFHEHSSDNTARMRSERAVEKILGLPGLSGWRVREPKDPAHEDLVHWVVICMGRPEDLEVALRQKVWDYAQERSLEPDFVQALRMRRLDQFMSGLKQDHQRFESGAELDGVGRLHRRTGGVV